MQGRVRKGRTKQEKGKTVMIWPELDRERCEGNMTGRQGRNGRRNAR